jgi:hypothetical protein
MAHPAVVRVLTRYPSEVRSYTWYPARSASAKDLKTMRPAIYGPSFRSCIYCSIPYNGC